MGLVERKKPSKPQGDVSPQQSSELYKETEITKTFEHDEFLKEVLQQKNTPKSQGKRIAIIGEPGAGKTTILQKIAQWLDKNIADAIIIWVSLADLRGKELKSYLFETWLNIIAEKQNQAEASKALKENFVSQFNQGRVWLLLDGLDEMSTSSGNPLTEIARQIRDGGAITQARIVLTCRVNLWDGNINALDDFDTYRTLNFSYPQQVEEFIRKWFKDNLQNGERLRSALKTPGKERIQDLVKNPLRLTLLCFNWQSGDGKLPETQSGLYQRFVDDFYKWKKDEFAINYDKRQQLNVKLGELAKAAIDKEISRFYWRQDFVRPFLGEADDENSLLTLALKLGWLNQVGVDTERNPVYAFFHASFQEYFAAKAIDDWHFFLNHVPNNPSQGIYRIFEPQWKQTILLWLGREEENLKQQKQEFIDALINFKDGCGKFMVFVGKGFYEYRAYFLAAAGISEFRDYFRADEIIKQIVEWTTGDLKIGFLNLKVEIPFYVLMRNAISSVVQETDRTKMIAALLQLMQLNDLDEKTRQLAAYHLTIIATGNETVIAALLQLLQLNDLDKETHWPSILLALELLGEIGTGNEKAIAALVQLLQFYHQDRGIDCLLAHYLAKIDPGNEKAIAVLVQLLQLTTVDNSTRRVAAESLGQIGTGNEKAIAALVQLLQSTTVDNSTRSQVAESLGQIGTGNQKAIAALVQLLQSTTVDNYTRRRVPENLGKIGTGNEFAIAALEQLLQSTTVDEDTRRLVAESLGKIDPGNQKAIDALEQLLQSTTVDNSTRRLIAYSLGEIGTGNQKAIDALVELLQSTTVDDETCRGVAESLGKIDPGNQKAIDALVELLQSTTVDGFTRRQVPESLGKIDPGNQKALAPLVELLQSTTVDDFTRRLVAESLGKIGTGNGKAIDALVELLQSTTVDEDTRTQVAESLGEIVQNNQHRFGVVKVLSGDWVLDYKYHLAWECAQNMPYADFYQAWHQHNIFTGALRSLKRILFTRII